MSKTEVSGKQIKDGSIEQVDLSSALSTDINTLKSDVSTLQTDVAGKASAASLATVATSGSYDDLTDKPTIPSLTAVEGDVAALDTRVTAVEADVASLQGASTPNLSDLGEVSITAPSSGEVLKYNGLGWANAADSSFSGDYNDLSNKPTLFDGAYSSLTGAPSLATVATSGSYNDLTNKPSLFSGSYTDLTNKPSIPSSLDDLSDVTITSPSNTQVLQYNGSAWVNAAAPSGGASNLDGLSDVVITSAAKGHFLAHDGTNFVNTRTIEANAAATTPLVVKAAASQTAALFQLQNSAGTVLSYFTPNGGFTIGSNSSIGGSSFCAIQAAADDQKSLVLKARAAQWNSMIECTDSSNNLRFGVGPSGNTTISNNYNGAIALVLGHSTNQTGDLIYAQNNAVLKFKVDKDGAVTAANATLTSPTAATKALVVKGAASQTANLFEAQNSSSSTLFNVDKDGCVNVRSGTGTAKITLNGGATSTSDGSAIFCQNNSVNIVGIGAASALGIGSVYDNTPALRSWANGFIVNGLTSGAGTNAMKFDTSTSKWTYDTSSARYKENIRDSQYGLSHVMQLQSRQFSYKDSGREDVGLIAEEVQPVIPELVGVNAEGEADSVSYDRMVSVLVKAVQELKQKNEELEARLAILENK